MSQLCKKISIALVVFENRVETNANMKVNFHVWTFTEQVHKQRKKASSDLSLSSQKHTKSPPCPQVKQFFSETSVLMCSRVILHHHTWSLVSEDLFWSLKAVLMKEAKRLYFFVTMEFFVSITFATELVHKKQKEKKIEASTHCCFWKTNLTGKMTVERRQNHLRQSQLIFQKTFRTLPQKWRNFQGCIFFLVWVEAQNEIGRNSFRIDWC